MVMFYADEQFPRDVTVCLRSLGYDILTVQEARKGNQKVPDDEVLAFATNCDRAVLTLNRSDFIQLHRQNANHAGVVACTENPNFDRLAIKIHEAVSQLDSLQGQLIRIYRDSNS